MSTTVTLEPWGSDNLARDDKHRFMHAFPNVDNAPSNAICRKLGFDLLEACEF